MAYKFGEHNNNTFGFSLVFDSMSIYAVTHDLRAAGHIAGELIEEGFTVGKMNQLFQQFGYSFFEENGNFYLKYIINADNVVNSPSIRINVSFNQIVGLLSSLVPDVHNRYLYNQSIQM